MTYLKSIHTFNHQNRVMDDSHRVASRSLAEFREILV